MYVLYIRQSRAWTFKPTYIYYHTSFPKIPKSPGNEVDGGYTKCQPAEERPPRSVAYPHLNIHFVFRSSTRISSFFSFGDKVPKLLRSGVVYLFKCRCCSASYVGQTTRHLHTRVSEHQSTYVQHIFPPQKPQVILPTLMTLKSFPLVRMIVN